MDECGEVTAGSLRVVGNSIAGHWTTVAIPSLDICFDMGRPHAAALSCQTVCLSHGHADHIGGLSLHARIRNMKGEKVSRYVMPPICVAPFKLLFEASTMLDFGVADVDGGTISGNNNDCHGDKRQESAQLLHPPTDYFDDLFDYERDLDSFATTSAEAVPVPSPLDTPNPVEPSAFSQFSPVQSAAYSPHSAPIAGKVKISDALGYLDALKSDAPDRYSTFLSILKDFKSQVYDTKQVVELVKDLFHDRPALLQGFNVFLPPGYTIEAPKHDSHDPMSPSSAPSSELLPALSSMSSPSSLPSTGLTPDFEAARDYVKLVKMTVGGNQYKAFLGSLHDYQSGSRDIANVTQRIEELFKDWPHLVEGFKIFLPDQVRVSQKEKSAEQKKSEKAGRGGRGGREGRGRVKGKGNAIPSGNRKGQGKKAVLIEGRIPPLEEYCAIIPATAKKTVPLKGGRRLACLPTSHVIPSMGYCVWEAKKKLKPEWEGLPSAQIGAAAKLGVQVSDVEEYVAVAYSGDTTIEGILQYQEFLRAKVLIVECTGLDAALPPQSCKERGHIHIEDLEAIADRCCNEHVVLIHFSARYRPKEIRKLVAASSLGKKLEQRGITLHVLLSEDKRKSDKS